MSVLEVAAAGKSYRKYSSEIKRVLSWFNLPFKPAEEHWVLQNISFTVQAGEALGLIGQNGAGKSTLLKMITGIVAPSTGNIKVNGRIAAILELGMGFNPEFTARRNAFHGLSMMGFSQAEIEAVMPELEAFADIDTYFDEPLRTYSSGMQMRVAFAVATAFRPDILIIDEALAVGDAGFQRKCFRRIEEFQNAGTALLYVSHEIESVKKICTKGLFLKNGIIESFGHIKNVCDSYEKSIYGYSHEETIQESDGERAILDTSLENSYIENRYGNHDAVIDDIFLCNSSGEKLNIIDKGKPFNISVRVKFKKTVSKLRVGAMIKTVDGITLFATNTSTDLFEHTFSKGQQLEITFNLNSSNLFPGTYYLNAGITSNESSNEILLDRRVDTKMLKIKSDINDSSFGLVNLSNGYTVKQG